MTAVMTSEEARALFDAAYDAELSEEQQRAFVKALASDAVLQADYARQRELRDATAALARAGSEVDLLAAVQHKLRARSGGKFYRDRFAERVGPSGHSQGLRWLLVLSASMITVALLWLLYDAGLLGLSQ